MSQPELSSDHLLDIDAALALVDATPVRIRRERVTLRDAVGRVLASDVHSDRDYPPFDKSLLDGFAIAEPIAGKTIWILKGMRSAGESSDLSLAPGEALQIMTGAPLPPGTRAVLPVEHCRVEGDRVALDADHARLAARGSGTLPRASEAKANDLILPGNTILAPLHLGALAQVGVAIVDVVAAPRARIVITGSEVSAPGERVGEVTIRDAIGPALEASLRTMGAHVVSTVYASDDASDIRRAIDAGESELLFVCGGMSMGIHDHGPRLLAEAGYLARISKLRMRPGKPFVFAPHRDGERFAFGLPGNPVSALVTTLVLASRLVRRLGGRLPQTLVQRALSMAVAANGPRTFFQPARYDGQRVEPLAWRGSADVFTLALADGLIVRPANDPPRVIDAVIDFLEFPR